MSKSVWLICPAYWQDHNRPLKIKIIKILFYSNREKKKGYRVLDPPLLPPYSYSATVARPPPPLFAGKTGKTGRKRKNRKKPNFAVFAAICSK